MPTLAIWGDPVVGQALTLLLRGSGYKAKFVPAFLPSSASFLLKETYLLVLTPTPLLSAEEREALLASLLEDTPGAANPPVLELVTLFEETPKGRPRSASWYSMAWPRGIEELERRIEAILSCHLEARTERLGGGPS